MIQGALTSDRGDPLDTRTRTAVQRQAQRRARPQGMSSVRILPFFALTGCLSLMMLMLMPLIAGATMAAGVYMYFAKDLPEPGQLHRGCRFKTTKIYGRPMVNATTGNKRYLCSTRSSTRRAASARWYPSMSSSSSAM